MTGQSGLQKKGWGPLRLIMNFWKAGITNALTGWEKKHSAL